MPTPITIRKDIYRAIEAEAVGPMTGARDDGANVTFTISDDTVERLENHYPGLTPVEALERLFGGRLN